MEEDNLQPVEAPELLDTPRPDPFQTQTGPTFSDPKVGVDITQPQPEQSIEAPEGVSLSFEPRPPQDNLRPLPVTDYLGPSPEDEELSAIAQAGMLDRLNQVKSITDNLFASPTQVFDVNDSVLPDMAWAQRIFAPTEEQRDKWMIEGGRVRAGLGQTSEMFGGALKTFGVQELGNQLESWGQLQQLQATARRVERVEDIDTAQKLVIFGFETIQEQLPNLMIMAATALGTGGLSSLAGLSAAIGQRAGGFMAGFALNLGDARQDFIEEQGRILSAAHLAMRNGHTVQAEILRKHAEAMDPDKNAAVLMAAGAAMGVLDYLGFERWFKPSGGIAFGSFKKAVIGYARHAMTAAMFEGGTEALQATISISAVEYAKQATAEIVGIAKRDGIDAAMGYMQRIYDERSRLLNEFAAGAVVGGSISPLTARAVNPARVDTTIPGSGGPADRPPLLEEAIRQDDAQRLTPEPSIPETAPPAETRIPPSDVVPPSIAAPSQTPTFDIAFDDDSFQDERVSFQDMLETTPADLELKESAPYEDAPASEWQEYFETVAQQAENENDRTLAKQMAENIATLLADIRSELPQAEPQPNAPTPVEPLATASEIQALEAQIDEQDAKIEKLQRQAQQTEDPVKAEKIQGELFQLEEQRVRLQDQYTQRRGYSRTAREANRRRQGDLFPDTLYQGQRPPVRSGREHQLRIERNTKRAVEAAQKRYGARLKEKGLDLRVRPVSIADFVRGLGGIWVKDKKTRDNLIRLGIPERLFSYKSGRTLDDIRQAMVDAGYLAETAYEDGVAVTSESDVIDALVAYYGGDLNFPGVYTQEGREQIAAAEDERTRRERLERDKEYYPRLLQFAEDNPDEAQLDSREVDQVVAILAGEFDISMDSIEDADIASAIATVVEASMLSEESINAETQPGKRAGVGGSVQGDGGGDAVDRGADGSGATGERAGGVRASPFEIKVQEFYRVLYYTKLERGQWQRELGVDDDTFKKLIERAYEDGRLYKNPRTGLPHRVARNRVGAPQEVVASDDPPFAVAMEAAADIDTDTAGFLKEAVNDAASMLQKLIPETTEIQTFLAAEELPPVEAAGLRAAEEAGQQPIAWYSLEDKRIYVSLAAVATWNNGAGMTPTELKAYIGHELIHSLKGLFTKGEWAALTNRAEQILGLPRVEYGGRSIREVYGTMRARQHAQTFGSAVLQDKAVQKLIGEEVQEEGVAHLYFDRLMGQDYDSRTNSLLDRISDFLGYTRAKILEKLGVDTYDEVIARIESGIIAKRAYKFVGREKLMNQIARDAERATGQRFAFDAKKNFFYSQTKPGRSNRKRDLIQYTELEIEANQLFKDIQAFEESLWEQGADAQQISERIKERYGFSISPEEVALQRVWWRIDTLNLSVETPPLPDRTPTVPGAAPLALNPAMRKRVRDLAAAGKGGKEIAETLSQETGKYIRLSRVVAEMEAAGFIKSGNVSTREPSVWTRRMDDLIRKGGMSTAELAERITKLAGKPVSPRAVYVRRSILRSRGEAVRSERDPGRTRLNFQNQYGVWQNRAQFEAALALMTDDQVKSLTSTELATILEAKFGAKLTAASIRSKRARLGRATKEAYGGKTGKVAPPRLISRRNPAGRTVYEIYHAGRKYYAGADREQAEQKLADYIARQITQQRFAIGPIDGQGAQTREAGYDGIANAALDAAAVPGSDSNARGGRPGARGAGDAGQGARLAGGAPRDTRGTRRFELEGFDGYVVPRPPASGEARLDFLVYPKGSPSVGPLQSPRKKLGPPVAEVQLRQRSNGWEVAYVKNYSAPGQGLIQRTYDAIEQDLGIKLRPSGVLTLDGYKVWQRRAPEMLKYHVPDSDTNPGEYNSVKYLHLLLAIARAQLRSPGLSYEDAVDLQARVKWLRERISKAPAGYKDPAVWNQLFALAPVGRRSWKVGDFSGHIIPGNGVVDGYVYPNTAPFSPEASDRAAREIAKASTHWLARLSTRAVGDHYVLMDARAKAKGQAQNIDLALLQAMEEAVGQPIAPAESISKDVYELYQRHRPSAVRHYTDIGGQWHSPEALRTIVAALEKEVGQETNTAKAEALYKELQRFKRAYRKLPPEAIAPAPAQRFALDGTRGVTRIERIGAEDPHPGPVLAFHGSPNAFKRFDLSRSRDIGLHFGTSEQANTVTEAVSIDRQANTMPVILDVRRVMDLPDMFNWPVFETAQEIEQRDPRLAGLSQRAAEAMTAVANPDANGRPQAKQAALRAGNELIRQELTRAGYDAIRYQNASEGQGWSYIVWQPGKVSSATSGEQMFALWGNRQPPAIVGINQILRDLIQGLGLTVRQGPGVGVRYGFNPNTGIIHQRVYYDLVTLNQNIGQVLMTRFNTGLTQRMLQWRYELMPQTQQPTAADFQAAFSQFMQQYLFHPGTAQANYPNFYTVFESFIDAQDKNLGRQLLDAQRAVEAYNKLAPAEMVQSMVSPADRDGTFDKLKKRAQNADGVQTIGLAASMYRLAIDELHPWYSGVKTLLEMYTKRTGQRLDLKTVDNAYKLLRLATNAHSVATSDITTGIKPADGVRGAGVSLIDALKEALGSDRAEAIDASENSRYRKFGAYLVAKRAVHLWDRYLAMSPEERKRKGMNPPTLVERATHVQAIADLEAQFPSFRSAAGLIYQFNDNLLTLKFEKGLITQEEYDGLQQNSLFYVPFFRSFDEQLNADISKQIKDGKFGVLRQLLGSNRNIIDPIASIAQDVYETRQLIAINDAKLALLKLAESVGPSGGVIAERLPANQAVPLTVRVEDALRSAANEAGLNPNDKQSLILFTRNLLGNDATAQIFTGQKLAEGKQPIVWVYENGVPVPMRLGDGELGNLMFQTLANFGQYHFDWLIKMAAIPTSAVRLTITTNPAYMLRNLFVDGFMASMYDRGMIPWLTQIRGFYRALSGHQSVKDYAANPIIMGGIQTNALENFRFDRAVDQLIAAGYQPSIWRSPLAWLNQWKNPHKLIRTLSEVSEATETGTRAALFEKALARARASGLTEAEAAAEAAMYSVDYIDYARKGEFGKSANKIVAFFNAAVQGLNRYYRLLAAQGDYGSAWNAYFKYRMGGPALTTREQTELGQSAWVWFYTVFVFGGMSTAISMAFDDDERVREVPQEIRATHWVIPINSVLHLIPKEFPGLREYLEKEYGNQLLRLPKAFETAWFANLMERVIYDGKQGNPRWFEGWAADMMSTITPPLMPQALLFPLEMALNRNLFTGQEIAPKWKQDLNRELQYDEYTSSFAKWAGAKLDISPYYIEHFMKGLGTSWARDFLSMNAAGLPWHNPTKPEAGPDEYFLARRFLWKAGKGSESGQILRDIMGPAGPIRGIAERLSIPYSKLDANGKTYKHYVDNGDLASANDLLGRLSPKERAFAIMAGNLTGRGSPELRMLNPVSRAEEAGRQMGTLRREIVGDRVFVEGKRTAKGEPVPIDAETKRVTIDILTQLQMWEMHNALVLHQEPGYAQKKLFDVKPLMAELQQASPTVHKALMAKYKQKHVLDADAAASIWPRVREIVESEDTYTQAQRGDTRKLESTLRVLRKRAEAQSPRVQAAPATVN